MTYPKELMERKQWVNWRLIPDKDGGKDKKMPFNPVSGKGAASNNPATWTDYATAADAVERYGFTGVGFMFSKDDDFVGVDIDHCYDPETKTFNDTAKAIIARQPTYMEFSPSGTGVHLFYKGKIPGTGNKNTKTGVEMYEHTRYFTMTGNKLDCAINTVAEDNGTLKWIHETYVRPPKRKNKKTQKNTSVQLTDDDLLELAKNAENGEAFTKLWEGEWQENYASQSEADMALCCKLAFWSGKNKEQMDRLFRQSGLFREKWDKRHHASGATYGEETLSKASSLGENTDRAKISHTAVIQAPYKMHPGKRIRLSEDLNNSFTIWGTAKPINATGPAKAVTAAVNTPDSKMIMTRNKRKLTPKLLA
jgi:putative DNA primase/helicase